MTMSNKGLSKLAEELGELSQVVGKKLACMDNDTHYDGTNLKERMTEEMGDVIAAIRFVSEKFDLSIDQILQRAEQKYDFYQIWDSDPNA